MFNATDNENQMIGSKKRSKQGTGKCTMTLISKRGPRANYSEFFYLINDKVSYSTCYNVCVLACNGNHLHLATMLGYIGLAQSMSILSTVVLYAALGSVHPARCFFQMLQGVMEVPTQFDL